MTSAVDRLGRMLSLVPWLSEHPDVPAAEVAREFGVTEAALRSDLELLFMCGLPDYDPGSLIDVVYTATGITLRNAETLARPLRLTPDEALSLLVAGRTLAAVPGLAERDALDRALAKLSDAVGPAATDSDRVRVELEAEGERLGRLQRAVRERRRLHLRYFSAGREELTERDVDPMRVFTAEGWWYLEGYCRRVSGVRLFRLDRMDEVSVLDAPAEVPAEAVPRDVSAGLFAAAPDAPLVVLDVGPQARWVADYYPCESVTERADGGLRLALRVGDTAWVRRLALRLGGLLRVVGPAELGEQVRDAAEAALATYGDEV